MPAVKMLGRRWSFATDDVPLLGFFPTLFHGLWALVLAIVWIVFGKHRDCYDGTTFTVVLAGLFTTFTMFFIIGCWTIYEGLKGAPTLPCAFSLLDCTACTSCQDKLVADWL